MKLKGGKLTLGGIAADFWIDICTARGVDMPEIIAATLLGHDVDGTRKKSVRLSK